MNSEKLFTTDRMRTQISSSHRLIELTRKLRYSLYLGGDANVKSECISADYFLDEFIPLLQNVMNKSISQRQSATLIRARKLQNEYEVKNIGIPEVVAESLFDNYFFKIKKDYTPRNYIRDQVKNCLNKEEKIELLLPILSRKPLSPIKNRGSLADLAEIQTIIRCAKLGRLTNNLSPTGCKFTILSDGLKYNRACGTPSHIVQEYQNSIAFWIKKLGVEDVINFQNYENWIEENMLSNRYTQRDKMYKEHCDDLSTHYDKYFNHDDLMVSLQKINEKDDIGNQLYYTFFSIITSVYYKCLYDGKAINEYYTDPYTQSLYIAYISSLHLKLNNISYMGLLSGFSGNSHAIDIISAMRDEAWNAAKRYVAISLTDRKLDTIFGSSPNGLKLTIHGKKDELHFISSSSKDVAMTAQHCVGGLDNSNGKLSINFRYRLEREARKELPVFIENLPDTLFNRQCYGPLLNMVKAAQPIYYIDNKNN
ncbi:L-tyrosine/L-tryptophan isonitrile synthase family protein [Photorhabdus tasmaniensis]|uniref:L-tyrosine/L-tryptophan isonitrile synthase family protein n=1 Tax=Photorhabdus tasmaniensis TaxID=1004159 RepID=UPI0040436712